MNKKQNRKTATLFVAMLFLVMVCVSAAQGLVQLRSTAIFKQHAADFFPKLPPMHPLNDPYFFWEDDFETEEYIDPMFSYDYVLDNWTVRIKNTYPIWTDPTWTRMKPITVVNNGGSLSGHAIPITVSYDGDMQPDYDDIRFKHEDYPTTWLDYWIESSDTAEAQVWVKIPVPSAMSQSDFYSVFTDWGEQWANDKKISIHASNEGAWDSDVAFGSDTLEATNFLLPGRKVPISGQ